MRRRASGVALSAALALALVASSAGPAAAQPYKWIDRDGRVHYGDQPPRDAKLEPITGKIQSFGGEATVAAVEGGGAAQGITLYGTSWCGYCKKARAWLRQNGVPFRDLDVEADASANEVYRTLGGTGVPLIVVGGRKMQGWNPERMAALLKADGG